MCYDKENKESFQLRKRQKEKGRERDLKLNDCVEERRVERKGRERRERDVKRKY